MDIKNWEGAIASIELALKLGIQLKPSGDRLEIIPPEGDYDKPTYEIALGQIKQNAEIVKVIKLDYERCSEMLSKANEWLSESNREFTHILDLWIRLDDIRSGKSKKGVDDGIQKVLLQ